LFQHGSRLDWLQLGRDYNPAILDWLPVAKSLPISCLDRFNNPLPVHQLTAVVSELELGQIAMQMLAGDRVIDTADPLLEDVEVALAVVRVPIATRVLAIRMPNRLVTTLELPSDGLVGPVLVRDETRAAIYVLGDRFP